MTTEWNIRNKKTNSRIKRKGVNKFSSLLTGIYDDGNEFYITDDLGDRILIYTDSGEPVDGTNRTARTKPTTTWTKR